MRLMIWLMNVDYHVWQEEEAQDHPARWSAPPAWCWCSLSRRSMAPIAGCAIGSISFQPSEIAKLVLLIFLADFLHKYEPEINDFRRRLLPCLAVVLSFCGPDRRRTRSRPGVVSDVRRFRAAVRRRVELETHRNGRHGRAACSVSGGAALSVPLPADLDVSGPVARSAGPCLADHPVAHCRRQRRHPGRWGWEPASRSSSSSRRLTAISFLPLSARNSD